MIKSYEDLTFTDDFLFGKILCDDTELCKAFVELLLGRKIASISVPEKQKPIAITPDGKGIRMDVFFEDDRKTLYNLEMQTTSNTDLPRRCRYYQGMLDLNAMQKGASYKELKDSVIVFICTFDPFGSGRHRYTFTNRCAEQTGLELKDGTQKVFINTHGIKDDVPEELQKLLRSINGESCGSAIGDKINSAVKSALSKDDWRNDYMTLAMLLQDTRDEGRIEGRKEGRKEGENLVTSMQQWLLNSGRMQDIQRSILDSDYRKQLLSEFSAANAIS